MLHKDNFTDLYDSIKAYNNLDKTGCTIFFSLFLLLDFMLSSRYNEHIELCPHLTENNRNIATDSKVSSHRVYPGLFNRDTWFGRARNWSTDSMKLTWNEPVVTTNAECWKRVSIPSRYKLVKICEQISMRFQTCNALFWWDSLPELPIWQSTSRHALGKDKLGEKVSQCPNRTMNLSFFLRKKRSKL